jgi:hypothetical protein
MKRLCEFFGVPVAMDFSALPDLLKILGKDIVKLPIL